MRIQNDQMVSWFVAICTKKVLCNYTFGRSELSRMFGICFGDIWHPTFSTKVDIFEPQVPGQGGLEWHWQNTKWSCSWSHLVTIFASHVAPSRLLPSDLVAPSAGGAALGDGSSAHAETSWSSCWGASRRLLSSFQGVQTWKKTGDHESSGLETIQISLV